MTDTHVAQREPGGGTNDMSGIAISSRCRREQTIRKKTNGERDP